MANQFSDQTDVLIVGCGYLGQLVALRRRKSAPDSRVAVTTRSHQKAAALAREGFEPVVLDWTDRRTLPSLSAFSRVLVAIAYDPRSGRSREESQVGGLANLLERLGADTHVVYISTTGVYHQQDGSWVDECSPARPAMPGGQAHLRAESLLRRTLPTSHTILRLAGIYGPGRVPLARQIAAGKPIDAGAEGYLNLIHVEDAATVVLQAWTVGPATLDHGSSLFAIADDLPVLRRAFYAEVAKRLCVPTPAFVAAAGTLSARSASNKRIWNKRMHRELVPRLQYPDYRAGLDSIDWSAFKASN